MQIIEPQSVAGLLVQWLEGESDAERKALTLAPRVLEIMQREHTLGPVSKESLRHYVLQVLVDAYTTRIGVASIEIVCAERRDTRREN